MLSEASNFNGKRETIKDLDRFLFSQKEWRSTNLKQKHSRPPPPLHQIKQWKLFPQPLIVDMEKKGS